jgi:PAS domain S-box-containing protein
MVRRHRNTLALFAVFVTVYFCACKAALEHFTFVHASASPVWPGTGLALAAMLLWGMRLWPAVFVGAFIVNLTLPADLGRAGAVVTSLCVAAGNTAEALLGALLAKRFARGECSFESSQDVFRFVFFAAIPSTILGATIGATTLALAGQFRWAEYPLVWFTWWTGTLVSDLLVAPFILIWWTSPLPARGRVPAILEAAALFLLLLAVSGLIFGPLTILGRPSYPLAYLAVPPLLWAVMRFRQHGAITAVAIMAAVAIWGTLGGTGPFIARHPNDSLLMLQTFVAVNTLSMLVLGAVVSERARVIESLASNDQRLRIALDAGRMGTWEWDIASGAVRWSSSLEQLHGLTPGKFAGTFQAFVDDIHPDDRQAVQQCISGALERRADHHIEYRLLLPDGQVRWVEGRGRILLGRDGQPRGMTGVCMDVTQRRAAQEERERLLESERAARAEAERASRAKDEFLAVLSHELRTPLTPVLLNASRLESDPGLPSHVRPELQAIRRNVELEARLIDDLLDLTRISRGKVRLDPRSTDLHVVVHHALEVCFQQPCDVHLVVRLAASSHSVKGDAARLQQVFWNLLNNARKFTPAGGTITVTSRNGTKHGRDGQAAAPDAIVVEVTDTGVGIEADLLPRLFNAFAQGGSGEARRRVGGLGLGLSISKALVEMHGGTLEGRSPGAGRGATFTVILPIIPAVATVTSGPTTDVTEMRERVPTDEQRPLKILLVEDHDATLMAIQRILSARNHRVTPATTVASAIEAASRQSFDLVISDLGLPDGLGYEVMRAIMANYAVRGIAISGYGMPSDIRQSKEAGFIEHLVKPVDAQTLEAAIRRVTSDSNEVGSESSEVNADPNELTTETQRSRRDV